MPVTAKTLPSDPTPEPANGPTQRLAESLSRAAALLADETLRRHLVDGPDERLQLPRSRHIFVNRNLKLSSIEGIGFDMDYTIARYSMQKIEQLSYDLTLARLVSERGYPELIAGLVYDHGFVMRGLAVDRVHGNLVKMNRFGHVGRAWHGLRQLPTEERRQTYRDTLVRPKDPRFAWIDTLFALPEAFLFAGIIDLLESRSQKVDYARLQTDIRETIDTVHRDGSLKAIIQEDLGSYVIRDPELGPMLHRLRSGGKKLFLMTNSEWSYTQAVMTFLLDGQLSEYPTWRQYFDVIIVGAAKPGFFSHRDPFIELDVSHPTAREVGEATRLERGRIYRGGNRAAFEEGTDLRGDRVLYVGDHIYGDILRSKKTSLWRTCMIVEELEDELDYTETRAEDITRLAAIEALRTRLDEEVTARKWTLNLLERRLQREPPPASEREAREQEVQQLRRGFELVRRAHRESVVLADRIEADIEEGFNPTWGLLFKEGNENSRFGEQVEQYACIYTSRASNLLFSSPMHYFRGPRERMPHELAGGQTGRMSDTGSEGPPPGAEHL